MNKTPEQEHKMPRYVTLSGSSAVLNLLELVRD